jgi:hypothetical protein
MSARQRRVSWRPNPGHSRHAAVLTGECRPSVIIFRRGTDRPTCVSVDQFANIEEPLHRGVVVLDEARIRVRLDQLIERRQHRRAGADMIGHVRNREIDPFARILAALPVERLIAPGLLPDQACWR